MSLDMSKPVFLPRLGDQTHYRAHGSADGTYPQTCRLAFITEVPEPAATGIGGTVALVVLNPTGMFFHTAVGHDGAAEKGGTWHPQDTCPHR